MHPDSVHHIPALCKLPLYQHRPETQPWTTRVPCRPFLLQGVLKLPDNGRNAHGRAVMAPTASWLCDLPSVLHFRVAFPANQGVLKLLENGLNALASKLPAPAGRDHGGGGGFGDGGGLTRPGSFLFEFLAQFGITAHSASALNAAIDAASDILAAADVEAGRTTAKAAAVA